MDLSADSFANLTRLRDLFAFPEWIYEHKRKNGGFVYLVKFSAFPFSNWQEHHEGSEFVYTHGTSEKYYAEDAVYKINDHMRQVTVLTKDPSQLLFQLWRFAKNEGGPKEISKIFRMSDRFFFQVKDWLEPCRYINFANFSETKPVRSGKSSMGSFDFNTFRKKKAKKKRKKMLQTRQGPKTRSTTAQEDEAVPMEIDGPAKDRFTVDSSKQHV